MNQTLTIKWSIAIVVLLGTALLSSFTTYLLVHKTQKICIPHGAQSEKENFWHMEKIPNNNGRKF